MAKKEVTKKFDEKLDEDFDSEKAEEFGASASLKEDSDSLGVSVDEDESLEVDAVGDI